MDKTGRFSKTLYCDTMDHISTSVRLTYNPRTDHIGIGSSFEKLNNYLFKTKYLFGFTTNGMAIQVLCKINETTDFINFPIKLCKVSDTGHENNKDCPGFLGSIAEEVLSYVYTNVERMGWGNPGYDFICGKGHKIDVKSSVLTAKRPNLWEFRINNNKIADYFLCLAFDNRDNLNPQHIWLLPGKIVNNKVGTSISKSTISKWSEYEQPLDKVISCCDIMKNNGNKNE